MVAQNEIESKNEENKKLKEDLDTKLKLNQSQIFQQKLGMITIVSYLNDH